MPGTTTWKALVHQAVRDLPNQFRLADLTAKRPFFERYYPENRFIEAKIRQSLQVLRNQGILRFLGNGRYERIDVSPAFSPLLDSSAALAFSSRSQAARVMLETWAEMNLYCLSCSSDSLMRLAANMPVADFECVRCEKRYQLKTKNGRFGSVIAGAAYRPTIAAIRDVSMPEHIFVEYDPRFATVVYVDAIPGKAITEEHVVARRPLSTHARRAGWQGCTIRITNLPSVRIVQPAGIERSDVRSEWHALVK